MEARLNAQHEHFAQGGLQRQPLGAVLFQHVGKLLCVGRGRAVLGQGNAAAGLCFDGLLQGGGMVKAGMDGCQEQGAVGCVVGNLGKVCGVELCRDECLDMGWWTTRG